MLDLEPVAERWSAFGWAVDEVDGHDLEQLAGGLGAQPEAVGRPRVVIAKTTFGKGVSYMENRIEWHYLPMSDEQFAQAVEELDAELVGSTGARP